MRPEINLTKEHFHYPPNLKSFKKFKLSCIQEKARQRHQAGEYYVANNNNNTVENDNLM